MWFEGPAEAEKGKIDTSPRWLRRMNQVVLELDLRLAGKGHCESLGCVVVNAMGS